MAELAAFARALWDRLRSERGASPVVEYGVLAVGIAATIVVLVAFLGRQAAEYYDCVGRGWATLTNC